MRNQNAQTFIFSIRTGVRQAIDNAPGRKKLTDRFARAIKDCLYDHSEEMREHLDFPKEKLEMRVADTAVAAGQTQLFIRSKTNIAIKEFYTTAPTRSRAHAIADEVRKGGFRLAWEIKMNLPGGATQTASLEGVASIWHPVFCAEPWTRNPLSTSVTAFLAQQTGVELCVDLGRFVVKQVAGRHCIQFDLL